MDKDVQQFLADNHPVRRLGTADEVAALVAWPASDASSMVNGRGFSAPDARARGNTVATSTRPTCPDRLETAQIAGPGRVRARPCRARLSPACGRRITESSAEGGIRTRLAGPFQWIAR
jgi:hypothetical protein